MNCATRCKHNAPGRGCTLFKGRSWLQCRRATVARPQPLKTAKGKTTT
jgi:hypothetical protein